MKLGDITVIVGPPNTGKTYSLKAMYAAALPLDQFAFEYSLKQIMANQKDTPLTRDIYFELMDIYRDTELLLSQELAENRHKKSRAAEKVSPKDRLKEMGVIAKTRYTDSNIIVEISKKYRIKMHEILKGCKEAARNLWGLIPHEDSTNVKYISETGNAIDILGLMDLDLLSNIIQNKIPREQEIITKSRDTTVKTNIYAKVADETLEIEIKIQATQDLSQTHTSTRHPYIMRRGMHSVYMNNAKKTINVVINTANTVISGIEEYAQNIGPKGMGINAVRYIPFGRSAIINIVEEMSHDPFWADEVLSIAGDLTKQTYMRWIAQGRKQMLENKDHAKALLETFSPLLLGQINIEQDSKELTYHRFGAPSVPIKWASALASEVAGILLPLVATPRKSLVLIEEPEAQLHYAAQVLMALTLGTLAQEFNHKIVISTHSDIIPITLAYVSTHQWTAKGVTRIIHDMLETQGVHAKDMEKRIKIGAAKITDAITNFSKNVTFHYYKPKEKQTEIIAHNAKDILMEVPGISKVFDKLLRI